VTQNEEEEKQPGWIRKGAMGWRTKNKRSRDGTAYGRKEKKKVTKRIEPKVEEKETSSGTIVSEGGKSG